MNNFLTSVTENVSFFLEFLGIIILTFLVAYLIEKLAKKRTSNNERILTTRKITVVGMFSAISTVLYLFDFPVPFIAPGFYELDFSEIPALIAAFAYGPVAGVLIELCKQILKLFIKGTTTAFVGDLANFVVGCSLIVPASSIYLFKKNKKRAILSCIVGTLCITAFGTVFNAVYLLPAFAKLYGMDLEAIIGAGTAIHSGINSITSFVMLCVAPLNLLKGTMVSVITMFIYKPLHPFLKKSSS